MLEVLRSGRLSLGPTIDRFEELFAETVGAPYAAAVSCGTAGLHLLCRIAGLGPGDEVITSPYSFVASANCFIYEGATPVFADVDARTMNLDPAAVEAAITRADEGDRRGRHLRLPVRARPAARALRAARARADPGRLRGARRRVQAAPRRLARRRAVFAFYPNKQITTGEGGIVDDALRGRVAAARQPPQPGPRRRRRLARPRAARLQLPHRRHPRGARHRPAREARHDPRRCARPRRPATASCSPASTGSRSRSPTTPTTSARGSSTSSSSRAGSTASA